jgi:hypothetical protein
MISMITNIYNKKTKSPTLNELFTATGKLKKCFQFPVAVKNSINVGPLVFLLEMFVITENIMKHPVYTVHTNAHTICEIFQVMFCS